LEGVTETEVHYLLYTSWEHEKYTSLKGYARISHQGVDTESLIGRKKGECSIVLAEEILEKFNQVIMTESLYKAVNRESVIIAYPLGNQKFICAVGKHFLKEYNRTKELIIKK
jgi:hypothetical protein